MSAIPWTTPNMHVCTINPWNIFEVSSISNWNLNSKLRKIYLFYKRYKLSESLTFLQVAVLQVIRQFSSSNKCYKFIRQFNFFNKCYKLSDSLTFFNKCYKLSDSLTFLQVLQVIRQFNFFTSATSYQTA